MPAQEVFLRAVHVSKRYGGVVALDDVDFTVYAGERHCLVGENGSGKSTLVKILTGVVFPDPGARIELGGRAFARLTPQQSIGLGVQVVHQDLSVFPNLTVAENIALPAHLQASRRLVRWRAVRRMAAQILERIGVPLDLDATVGQLPVADQQVVAICRAFASNARLLVLDEPTASLTQREVNRLFGIVRELQARGIATLFISHRLDEVLEIGERVTVLRDGRRVGTFAREEVDPSTLARLMTGKEIWGPRAAAQGNEPPARVILEVRHLSRRRNFADVSLTVREGEVVGLIGPLGSGRTELALSLFGMNPPDSGEVWVDGRRVRLWTNQEAIRAGIAYVPENRLTQGLVTRQSVASNLMVTALERLAGAFGLIGRRRRRAYCEGAVRTFDIRAASIEAPVRTLSGGNQQKVVMAKWLLTQPRVLILDGPTVGIDVGARETIYAMIRQMAERGVGVLLISEEVPEVLANCHRILVMKRGRVVAEFRGAGLTEARLREALAV